MNEHIKLVIATEKIANDAKRLYQSMRGYETIMFANTDENDAGYQGFRNDISKVAQIASQFTGDYLNQAEVIENNIRIESQALVTHDSYGVMKLGETYFCELAQSPITILSIIYIVGSEEPWITYRIDDYNTTLAIHGAAWASEVEKWIRR